MADSFPIAIDTLSPETILLFIALIPRYQPDGPGKVVPTMSSFADGVIVPIPTLVSASTYNPALAMETSLP